VFCGDQCLSRWLNLLPTVDATDSRLETPSETPVETYSRACEKFFQEYIAKRTQAWEVYKAQLGAARKPPLNEQAYLRSKLAGLRRQEHELMGMLKDLIDELERRYCNDDSQESH